jgi:hypothetical protein
VAKLAEDVKERIVQELACFRTPAAVVKEIKAVFGIDVTPQQVEAYDPNKVAGRALSKKWRTIFEATRAEYIARTADIGVSHKAIRLRVLQRMIDRAETIGNYALTAEMLAQAAKEMGDAFSNRQRHEVTGKDGGPIQTEEHVDLSGLSDEQLRSLERIAGVLAGEEPEQTS